MSLVNATERVLYKERATYQLLFTSILISSIYAITIFDHDFIVGAGRFWTYPQGTIPNSQFDMAQWLVSYLYLVKTPWSFPLLFTPDLNYPSGVVTFWCDPVPWLPLLGRAIYSATGVVVNVGAPYLVSCFILNSISMTLILIWAGQRTIIATAIGSLLAVSTPWFLFRWGHIPQMGQYLILCSLALYIRCSREGSSKKLSLMWLVLLSIATFTNPYLLLMCLALWFSSMMKTVKRTRVDLVARAAEMSAVIAIIVLMFYCMGVFQRSSDLSSSYYGVFSLNILSPFVPQMSGIFYPLANYHMTMYEGFSYLGLGVILLVLYSLRYWYFWLRAHLRAHAILMLVFLLLLVLAVSNNIYIGRWLALSIPLPSPILNILGIIRSSGRLFWPIGYSVIAGSLILVLRNVSRRQSAIALALVTAIQLVDVEPLRSAIAASTRSSPAPLLDQQAIVPLMRQAHSVAIFPTASCADALGYQSQERITLIRENMELQLMAARSDRSINSVFPGRQIINCNDEQAARDAPIQPGILYIYLYGSGPQPSQISGKKVTDVCKMNPSFTYCTLDPADARRLDHQ